MRVAGLWLRSIRATYECYPKYRGPSSSSSSYSMDHFIYSFSCIFSTDISTLAFSLCLFSSTPKIQSKGLPRPKERTILYTLPSPTRDLMWFSSAAHKTAARKEKVKPRTFTLPAASPSTTVRWCWPHSKCDRPLRYTVHSHPQMCDSSIGGFSAKRL